ncbi:MAG: methylmalonyl-CoA mutase family protein [Deltaproteobacteria bacterium]|nr:methylmalonyl-CoA mutase family protein [Deltaproteobacteria bacterium]
MSNTNRRRAAHGGNPASVQTAPGARETSDPSAPEPPTHVDLRIRIVTATSLFDGHDASINIMRRLLQAAGAEVIHLGHNRSAREVVDAAIQEDAQAIAISSYQGGHIEYFSYIHELLAERGCGHIRIFGGGGGVIVPHEIEMLRRSHVAEIFSPEDGRRLGLQGMIEIVLEGARYATLDLPPIVSIESLRDLDVHNTRLIARFITWAEQSTDEPSARPSANPSFADLVFPTTERLMAARREKPRAPVVGITGPGGAGKSSLTDELLLRFLETFETKHVAVLSVDPSKRRTGGALLGDRIRMNSVQSPRVYMRSLATRSARSELSLATQHAIGVCQAAGFDLILVETAGTGQGDSAIAEVADGSIYVMTAEFGAPSQLEKIEMLDTADLVAINKFERRGSKDALREVRRHMRRTRPALRQEPSHDADLPVIGTNASRFADAGVTTLFRRLLDTLTAKGFESFASPQVSDSKTSAGPKLPEADGRYLADIAAVVRGYHRQTELDARSASDAYSILGATTALLGPVGPTQAHAAPPPAPLPDHLEGLLGAEGSLPPTQAALVPLADAYRRAFQQISKDGRSALQTFAAQSAALDQEALEYRVRGESIRVPLAHTSLAGLSIPKVALPRFRESGDLLRWLRLENFPGTFPFTAGVFPLKRTTEDPTRMFAGEGPPERTNQRFHLLSRGQTSVRLSTAFDSVTLYGEDPDERPDIFGKIGESGVSVATIEDTERLYAGFDLRAKTTSVSMTINGPAPILLAFYFNAAIRQGCRRFLKDHGRLSIPDAQVLEPDSVRGDTWARVRRLLSDDEFEGVRRATLAVLRGTVQADILKEDQAQNTCIFSTEFALRLMGDVQAFFIEENVRNYYSVSISGYHIAEAGANAITQLAFTLANAFTYVQYYALRGMAIDAFAPNLSFFFSNGLEPEYLVLGRVARRIWAIAMKHHFGADEKSQRLKYHVQTSGRSLHAMEIDFNDIRTTLQALLALEDNCNSLHTNAFDEALTTPTESSVRRALAIQMIINREFGPMKNENPLQGSFFVEALTDRVEALVLDEFERLAERGGVLGAMETQYQRAKIQDESLRYEAMKHDGSLPIIGVNTFENEAADYAQAANSAELRRTSNNEKNACIDQLRAFKRAHEADTPAALRRLKAAARCGHNIFRELMETAQVASLGQITNALYEVGGRYRRNA